MTWTRLVAGRNTDCLHLRPDGTKGNLSETGGRVGAGGVGVRREGRTKNAENWSHDGKYLLYNSKSAQASLCAASRRRPQTHTAREYRIRHLRGPVLSE